MVAGGVRAVHLDVEHVGQPRQRMPVPGVPDIEGPDEPVPRESFPDMGILRYVGAIVEDEEVVPAARPVEDQGQRRERENDQERRRPAVAGGG